MRVPDFINHLIFFISIFLNLKLVVFLFVALFRKEKSSGREPSLHHYAVLICARNEANVIADLLDSIKSQSYPQDLIDVFVMADNCTDSTADVASSRSVHVYTRSDPEKVGKGYALEALMNHIREDYPEGFDGYFVFDADNILEHDYIEQMNRKFSDGHDIVTGFRNSKNFGDNWISAGNSLWYLWDSKYLNYPRYLLGISCNVSGTGYFFSRKIAEKLDGWPYHMLTEDWEFSFDQVTKGEKFAFCRQAVLYDEQPTSFIVSCRQRIRWLSGLLQVMVRYMKKVFRGIFHGNLSCFELILFAPVYVICVASLLLNLGLILALVWGLVVVGADVIQSARLRLVVQLLVIGGVGPVAIPERIGGGVLSVVADHNRHRGGRTRLRISAPGVLSHDARLLRGHRPVDAQVLHELIGLRGITVVVSLGHKAINPDINLRHPRLGTHLLHMRISIPYDGLAHVKLHGEYILGISRRVQEGHGCGHGDSERSRKGKYGNAASCDVQ